MKRRESPALSSPWSRSREPREVVSVLCFQLLPLHQFTHHVGLHPGHTTCSISPFPRLDQSGVRGRVAFSRGSHSFHVGVVLLDPVCWCAVEVHFMCVHKGRCSTVLSGCDCAFYSLVVFHTGLLSCLTRGFQKGAPPHGTPQ